jgi:glyoxylase-like metal-dependent hydrolase (beta-lactamase superfamily II)
MQDFIQTLSDKYENIHFIEGDRNGNYPYSHSLLVGNTLIDTGVSGRRLKKIQKDFQINTIVLSHWHEDHISGNSLFPTAKFMCHKKDRIPIEDIGQMFPYYLVEGTKAGEEFRALFNMFGMENTKISGFIEDNETIDTNDSLRCIHTPGHTAGHCGFYEENSKIAFFGDLDLTRFPYYASIDSDLMEYENSIDKLKNLGAETVVLGHRNPVYGKNNIRSELDNFKSVIFKRDERILANLSEEKPIQPVELKGKNLIYRRYTYESFEIISELVMIEKHFEKFLKNGLITRKNDGYILS